eukprot:Clim_evm60s156 gene=Clim_evmTU60s156
MMRIHKPWTTGLCVLFALVFLAGLLAVDAKDVGGKGPSMDGELLRQLKASWAKFKAHSEKFFDANPLLSLKGIDESAEQVAEYLHNNVAGTITEAMERSMDLVRGRGAEELPLPVKALLATAAISSAPTLLVMLIPVGSNIDDSTILKFLLSFAVGGLLGDVFLHLLPHSGAMGGHHDDHHGDHHGGHHGGHHNDHHDGHHDDHHGHDHSHDLNGGLLILAGIAAFFFLELLTRWLQLVLTGKSGHGHSHENGPKQVNAAGKKKMGSAALLNMLADFAHNVTDGMAIGAAFSISETAGYSTTAAIFFHEVPHEVGDIAILIESGYSKFAAMAIQFMTAAGAMLGTYLGLEAAAAGAATGGVDWVAPFTAGGFIYIATAAIIPDLLESVSFLRIILYMLGMYLGVFGMVVVAKLEAL